MKTYHFLPVFILLLISYIGLHYYAGRWLARVFTLAPAPAAFARAALLSLAFLSPFTMYLKRAHHAAWLEPFYAAGYAWMGLILMAAFLFACSDLAAVWLRRAPWFTPELQGKYTLVAFAVAALWGAAGGFRAPDLREVRVAIKDLPAGLEGFKIAQISDMHVDSGWKLRQFGAIVDKINAAAPDLVLVTGDLIDPGITCNAELEALAARLKPRLGVYGALGNHEYYYGLEAALGCYRSFGIKVLRNEAADLGPLAVIGLGDVHTEHMTREDVLRVLERNRSAKFTLLMSHQPVFLKEIAAAGDYLGFSGHTHRGQIFPFHFFTWLFYRHFYGLYNINNSSFYVTSGAGTWGPPLRWLAPAEIPLLILTRA